MDRRLSAAMAILLAVAACQKAPAPVSAAPSANTAAATPPASTSDADEVRAFLAGLYAHYQSSKAPLFDPYDANAAQVFDADTLAVGRARLDRPRDSLTIQHHEYFAIANGGGWDHHDRLRRGGRGILLAG